MSGPKPEKPQETSEPTADEAPKSVGSAFEAAAKQAAKTAAREATAAAKRLAKEAAAAAKKAAKKAEAERKANRNAEKERKERVIHTRVPESLDQELKNRANSLGVSVSNLVRNALNHTFGLVEDVITDTASVARSAAGDVEPTPAKPAEPAPSAPVNVTVFGYQRCVLGMNALCESCNAIIAKGTEGAVAVLNIPSERPQALCLPCLDKEISA